MAHFGVPTKLGEVHAGAILGRMPGCTVPPPPVERREPRQLLKPFRAARTSHGTNGAHLPWRSSLHKAAADAERGSERCGLRRPNLGSTVAPIRAPRVCLWRQVLIAGVQPGWSKRRSVSKLCASDISRKGGCVRTIADPYQTSGTRPRSVCVVREVVTSVSTHLS
jgi:hypothetical protein